MLFKSNPTYGLVPVQVEGVITIRDVNYTQATVNRQVLPSAITVTGSASNTGTANALLAASDYTLKPGIFAQPFTVFCNPNGSAAGAATNTATLPLGLSQGVASTLGSEYVIDLSAFPADIVGAQASLISGTRNATTTVSCVVSAIDNANKLVYINVVTNSTGAPAQNNATNALVVDVQFVDYQFGG